MERMLHIDNDESVNRFADKVKNSEILKKINSIVGLDKIGRWYEIVTSKPLDQSEIDEVKQVFPNLFFDGYPVRIVTCNSYGEICSIQAHSRQVI